MLSIEIEAKSLSVALDQAGCPSVGPGGKVAVMQEKPSDITDLDPGAHSTALAPARVDETDYEHRKIVNLLAVVFLIVISAAIIWTVHAINESERMQRCINSGRSDCVKIETPPSSAVRMPVR